MAEFIEVISEQAKKDIDELVLKLSAVSKEINQINAKGKKVRFPSEAKKNVEQTARATKKLNAAEKETKRLSDAVQRQRAKYSRTISDNNRKLHKLRFETNQANRLEKQRAIISSKLSTEYQKQQARISLLSNRYKELATKQQMGIKLSKREERELEHVTQQINKKQRALKRVDANIGNYQRNVGNYKSAWKGLGNIVRTAVTAFGLFSALEIGKQIFRQVKEIDKLNRSLKETTESVAEFNRAIIFLKDLADRSGASIDKIQSAFVKFRAAAQASNLTAQETREIFDSVTVSLGLMGASSEDTKGALRALEQMISKGKVQAEEIRGQLGERLPGAYAILAKSIGMTTEELSKQLELGNVYADEVLPKFAKELQKVYGIDNQKRVETLAAEQGRLNTAWSEFIRSLEEDGGFITNAFQSMFSAATAVVTMLQMANKTIPGIQQEGFEKDILEDIKNDEKEINTVAESIVKNYKQQGIEISFAEAKLNAAKMVLKSIEEQSKKSWSSGENFEERRKAIQEIIDKLKEADSDDYREAGRKIAQSVKKGLESGGAIEMDNILQELEMPNESLQEFIDGLKEAQRNTEKLKELMEQMRVNDIIQQRAGALTNSFNVSFSKIKGFFDEYEDDTKATALATMEFASGISQTMMENEQQRIANEMRLNRQMYAEMINDAEGNAQQQEEIREQRERKEAELRRRQAQAERKQALFEIAINTATAIIKVLPDFVAAALIGAMGAAQAAFVSSQPLPQYKHGRKDGKEEYAILGDGGKSEAVTDKQGNLKNVSPDKPTVMKLDRGDRVIPDINDYYEDLNNKLMLANVQASASNMRKQNERQNDAYNVEKAVVKALRKAKFVNNNNIDVGNALEHEAWKAKYK